MAATTAALIASALAATASTVHSIEQSNQQRRLAGQEANRQKSAADQMMRDQQNQKAADDATQMAIDARKRQKMQAGLMQGRAGTILTGSGANALGAAPATGMPNKTLLGQ